MRYRWMLVGLGWLWLWGQMVSQADDKLTLHRGDTNGWLRLSQVVDSTEVLRLETSQNLQRWEELARSPGGLRAYPDLAGLTQPWRFYRSSKTSLSLDDDWKNQVLLNGDPFLATPTALSTEEPRWIKFTIVLSETNKVYFQDSRKYLFHYDFAVQRLAPFAKMSRAQFDTVTLHRTNQQAVLGALLWPARSGSQEIGVQLVGQDAYTPEQIIAWFNLIKAVLAPPPGFELYYFPTYEQAETAQANRALLASQGVSVSSVARWMVLNQSYASGWAVGRLVYVPAAEIDQAYTEGRLKYSDILLTDAVPAEIPPLAGIISLSPATPNSHVAILAQSFGVPFAYFASAEEQQQVRSWTNQLVVLRIDPQRFRKPILAFIVEGQMPPEFLAELQALKQPQPLNISPKTSVGKFNVGTDDLVPSDIRYVGGKAANFGVLRRAIPTNSPTAIAFTFDLWDAFLNQTLADGKTLRQTIQERLARHTYPPNMALLRADLAAIRDLFTDAADFTVEQREAILSALAGFSLTNNIRFRSSTNVEDAESFSGAGLYDSYSGCLADDLDGDNNGPSHCDPTEVNERGIFRALKKVYASFYNDNAFLERLRHRIDENQVGMAVLVHYSTPDVIEMANGVAAAMVNKSPVSGDRDLQITLVSQLGAVSVANPEPNARPEKVTASVRNFGNAPFMDLVESSSLTQLGAAVMEWPGDYQTLVNLIDVAAQTYEKVFPEKSPLQLDLEYKKIAPGFLHLKQIREIPQLNLTNLVAPYLLHRTNQYTILQGEHGNVLANHRMKSRWSFQTRNLRLDPANLGAGLYQRLAVSYLEGGEPRVFSGGFTNLPNHQQRTGATGSTNLWRWGSGFMGRTMELLTGLSTSETRGISPLLVLDDANLTLRARHSVSQPILLFDTASNTPTLSTTPSDEVQLVPVSVPGPGSLLQKRQMSSGNLAVTTEFYWPPKPTGFTVGYTAPLQAWVQTTITGLISQPITLTGFYSQTYRPAHHNFAEEFLFDPHLEPGIAVEIKDELTRNNIRALYAYYSIDTPARLALWKLDNTLEPLATGTSGREAAARAGPESD